MSVDRTIIIKLLNNKDSFSDFFLEFVTGFWYKEDRFSILSLEKEDTEEYNYINFSNFIDLKPILDYRESRNYTNYLSLFVKNYDERILLSSKKTINKCYSKYSSLFELNFTLGIGKRIKMRIVIQILVFISTKSYPDY